MEQIKHTHVGVRGVRLHVAELGTGSKVVLFLHGFPEIWYSWRYQLFGVAKEGYRAISIDYRGYGLSEKPAEPQNTTFMDLVEDVVALLGSMGISKAFLVGKDFGALVAYLVAAIHPERVVGVITLGIPFMLPGASAVQRDLFPKGFYILRWQEPGRAEADFGRLDIKTVIRNIYILFSSSKLPIASDDKEIMDLVDASVPLPSWFTEKDLAEYASLYEKSGFETALQVPYRTLHKDCGITDPKVTSPALLIMGEKDYVLKFPGMEDYIRSGQVKHFMPNLDIDFMQEGSHFVQEQFPDEVNQKIVAFLMKHHV